MKIDWTILRAQAKDGTLSPLDALWLIDVAVTADRLYGDVILNYDANGDMTFAVPQRTLVTLGNRLRRLRKE